jgi:hypothetical protein
VLLSLAGCFIGERVGGSDGDWLATPYQGGAARLAEALPLNVGLKGYGVAVWGGGAGWGGGWVMGKCRRCTSALGWAAKGYGVGWRFEVEGGVGQGIGWGKVSVSEQGGYGEVWESDDAARA